MVSPEHKYLLIELLQKESLAQGAACMHSILFDQALIFKSDSMLQVCVQNCLCVCLLLLIRLFY